ncbi:MAG: polysaccharide biosynthesis C-terminal domain-containing protein [Bacteroidetes bacterium]|nr:polysaccharide biosynthesis C-terminal domain-containing protein [Bacteroidota bacterium]
MNQIKQLAGQTAIYGLPSIVGRLLNYFLVPLYTYKLSTDAYGVVTEMYAYTAFLLVILMYGMETAFFRYSELEKDKNKVYSTGLISVLMTSVIFILLASVFSQDVASLIKHPQNKEYIIWFGLILGFDAITSIPFAKLRAENKAKRFALIKSINISANIGFNLFFIVLCPLLLENEILVKYVNLVYDGEISVKYIFISNLIASSITIALLLPEIFSIERKFDRQLWKKLIVYALPLMVLGMAGNVNEMLDRLLLKYLLPENIALSQVGIYGACYKVSIIMTIFIQAYKYAAEPFFFAQAKSKNAKDVYAHVLNYFVIIVSLIFLVTMMYMDDIVIRFIGPEFRVGMKVIPILLLANLFLGIFYNLSIWYKLTNKTMLGAYIAILGAIVTIALNIYWIPRIGYIGSAWATLICYAAMMIISFVLGHKYYPVKYNYVKITGYIGLAVLLFLFTEYLDLKTVSLRLGIHSAIIIFYLVIVFIIEKPKFNKSTI